MDRPTHGKAAPIYYSEVVRPSAVTAACNDMWNRGYRLDKIGGENPLVLVFIRKDWAV